MTSLEYRRRRGAEDHPWHFCTNCRSWPSSAFDRTNARPNEVCSECESLQRRQLCTPVDSTYL